MKDGLFFLHNYMDLITIDSMDFRNRGIPLMINAIDSLGRYGQDKKSFCLDYTKARAKGFFYVNRLLILKLQVRRLL